MGISHLLSFVEHLEKGFPLLSIAKTYYEKTQRNTVIVIDTSGFSFSFFSQCNDDVSTMNEFIEKMAQINKKYHIELIFVFDGMNQNVKINESLKRLKDQIKQNKKFFSQPKSVNDTPRGIFSGLKRVLKMFLMKHGFECIRAYSEADPVVVQIAKERKAYGIVSDDSDFLLSDVFHVFGISNFIHFYKTISSPKYKGNPIYYSIKGFDIRTISNFIGIERRYYPMFCLLCGNDFTKKIAGNLRKKLDITIKYDPTKKNENDHEQIFIIRKVIGYLKQTQLNIKDMIQIMKKDQTEEFNNQLQMAIDQTFKMFVVSQQPVNRKELQQKIIPLCKYEFPSCRYSFSLTIDLFSFPRRPSVCCWNIFPMPEFISSDIRKVIYSLYKQNTEVIEYYDKGDNMGTDGIVLKTTSFKKGKLPEWLEALGFDKESLELISSFENEKIPFWKTMLFITWKYILDRLKIFPFFPFFFYNLYQASEKYSNQQHEKFKFAKKKFDHRLVVHSYNYFHCVSTNLMEIVVDYCKFDNQFIESFYALNIHQYAREYENFTVESFTQVFNEFIEKDTIAKRMFDHFKIIDERNCIVSDDNKIIQEMKTPNNQSNEIDQNKPNEIIEMKENLEVKEIEQIEEIKETKEMKEVIEKSEDENQMKEIIEESEENENEIVELIQTEEKTPAELN